MNLFSFFFFLFSFFLFFSSFSQQQFLPLNREYNLWLERQLNHKNNFSHTGFKPYLAPDINPDSLETADSTHRKGREYKKLISRKLKSESLIVIDSGEFHLTIDPLFNFSYSHDFADTSLRADTARFYTNTRGILVRADFGKKVSVMSSFLESQGGFPQYIDDFVKNYQVVPGSGRVKPFKKNGYDYAMASGYVSYSPFKNLNFQAGHDKNFIGDGYRSLLLSDNAFNYPYLKITSSFFNNRIQYTNLYARLSSLDRIPAASTPEALFKPKAGTFHYLSIIPWKRLHLGLFEGTVWQRWDSTGTKPFNWNFINPAIFVNTGVSGLNGKNNAVLGANLKLKILKGLMLYSQFVLDDAENQDYGYQAGLKSFDLFTLKNLNFQVEYNQVQPYSFAHEIPLQNYTHYNQALGHPLGASFREFISILDYQWNDFFIQLKFNYAEYSEPGKNIFISDKPEPILPNTPYPMPTETALYYQDYKIGYLVNHKTNLNIILGLTGRSEKVSYPGWNLIEPQTHHTQLLYFGIRTSLGNQYFDF